MQATKKTPVIDALLTSITGRDRSESVAGNICNLCGQPAEKFTDRLSDKTVRHASPWRYWWQATCRRTTHGLSGPEPVLVILAVPGGTADWSAILDRCPELMQL